MAKQTRIAVRLDAATKAALEAAAAADGRSVSGLAAWIIAEWLRGKGRSAAARLTG